MTLTRSSAPLPAGAAEQEPARRGGGAVLLVLLVVGAVAALALGSGGEPVPPAPEPEPVDVELALSADGPSVTQGGVLVIPVELRNRGRAVEVASAVVYAEPVLDDPVVQAPTRVPAGADRRFVVVLAPECSLLRAGFEFRASVLLRVEDGPGDLLLDLGRSAVVRDGVAGLCSTG